MLEFEAQKARQACAQIGSPTRHEDTTLKHIEGVENVRVWQ